jgi:hypothetical protein
MNKKIISMALASTLALSSASALAEDAVKVTVTLDGETVTQEAYLNGWSTYAKLGQLDGSDDETEVQVRPYFEALGSKVSWHQEDLTVAVTSPSLYGNYYRIVNKATGKTIAADNYDTENLGKMVTVDIDKDNKNQVYRLVQVDDTYGYFVNMLSRRSLDVPDAVTDVDTQLIQYTYYSNPQQKMELTKDEDGYYTISPSHCDLFLADKDGVLVQTDEESDNTKWALEYVSGSVLDNVEKSEGYALLSDNRQRAVSGYFFSNLWISKQAANNAEATLAAADYYSLSAEEQAALLEDCLNYVASYQVGGTLPYDTVANYKIVSKTYEESYDIWRGHKCPCWIYEVEMDGDVEGQVHKFTFVSNEEDVPMVERSIEAIGRVPYAIRQYVHKLYWKAGDGANSFNGGGNEIWIRLNYEPATSMQIASTLCHELGHILDSNVLPNNDVWSYAESLDGCPVSGYGASNQAEDLAEFNKLYLMSLGTDTFDDLKKTYPNRFAVHEAMLYRADPEYFADRAEYDGVIEEIEEILEHRADDSVASSIDDSRYYVLRDKATGKVATVPDSSLENEVALTLEDYTGEDNQLFSVEVYGDSVRFFVKHSGSSIQFDDSALADKTVNQYGGYWAIDDRFAVYEQDGGYVFNSLRYDLSMSNDGVNVTQNKNATVWLLEDAGENASNLSYNIKSGSLSLKAGDMEITAEEEGDTWKLKDLGDNQYRIMNASTGEVIDILDLSVEPGAKAIVWSVTGEENQVFIKEDVDGGSLFKCVNSSLYLTVGDDGTLTQEERDESNAQVFEITVAE